MNTKTKPALTTLFGLLLLHTAASAQQNQQHAEATAEAHAEASGSHVERKTVTVTSENGRTVRKTTIFRNGKEETTTEILDAAGNVIDGGNDQAEDQEPDQDPQDSPRDPADDGDSRPWIGLRVQQAPPALRAQLGLEENEGAVIDAVAPGGPAADADVQVNDLLLKFDGQPIGSPADLRRALENCEVGQQVELRLLRRGREEQATVTLEAEPEDENPEKPRHVQDGADGEDGADGHGARGGQGGQGGSARAEVEIEGGSLENLDELLNNPDLPEEFKKNVREMRERMREFEERHMNR